MTSDTPATPDNEPISVRGTVTIDVEACKGCDLCIEACKPDVLQMTTNEVTNTRGYRYPELLVGCTGCRACADVCPDFVFQVFRYDNIKTWTPEGGLV